MPARELPINWEQVRFSSEAPALPEKMELALGLYREGVNSILTSPFFAFLSFYRVLELALLPLYPKPKDGRMALAIWINNNAEPSSRLGNVSISRVNQTNSHQPDLGTYFYVQCRCAIAHTERAPIAKPKFR